jgi:hypothetical protein
MATIPMGNFGQSVARPAPRVSIPANDPLGPAVDRVQRIAGSINDTETTNAQRAQKEKDDAETKARQDQMRELDRQATEAERAALRVKTIQALTGTKDKLADLHDQITQGVVDGTVPKDKAEAEFTKLSAKVLEGVGGDLPEEQRAVVMAELGGDAMRGGNAVRKAVTLRNRIDVTAGIQQTLEYLQRQYKTDPAKSTKQADDLIDQLGPHSTLNPEQLGKLKQGWKESTQYTAGYEMVSAGRTDRKALAEAEKAIASGLPDLDSQKRAALLDRAQAYRLHLDQQAELAANRLQREGERRMTQAAAEFGAFQALADKGTVLDPAYIDRVITATAGTPYQAGVKMLAQQARDNGGFASQPMAVQQATLDALNTQIATTGRTPELDKRKEALEKVVRGAQTDLERDPLRAGLDRGVITGLVPLDMSRGLPGMLEGLAQRVPAAERVGRWAGRAVSPTTPEEAALLAHQLDSLPVKERAGMVAALSKAMGPQAAQAFAAQVGKQDKTLGIEMAFGATGTTEGRFLSELVRRGALAKADGTSTKGEKQPEVKVGQWSAYVSTELEGLFPAQTLTDQTREAALLIAHGIASEGGGRLTSDDLERSVRLAVGGSIAEHNGRRIPLPAGVDADALDKRLRSITAAELTAQAPEGTVRAGGVAMPLAVFAESLPGQQLMYAGPGRYAVVVGGRPVLNAKGKAIVIGVR